MRFYNTKKILMQKRFEERTFQNCCTVFIEAFLFKSYGRKFSKLTVYCCNFCDRDNSFSIVSEENFINSHFYAYLEPFSVLEKKSADHGHFSYEKISVRKINVFTIHTLKQVNNLATVLLQLDNELQINLTPT